MSQSRASIVRMAQLSVGHSLHTCNVRVRLFMTLVTYVTRGLCCILLNDFDCEIMNTTLVKTKLFTG